MIIHGHSVGHWEDDTLVVDTTNFSPHDAGLSTFLPSSTQKHLVERFKLSNDGKQLICSGTMNEECDLEIARRFLKEDQE